MRCLDYAKNRNLQTTHYTAHSSLSSHVPTRQHPSGNSTEFLGCGSCVHCFLLNSMTWPWMAPCNSQVNLSSCLLRLINRDTGGIHRREREKRPCLLPCPTCSEKHDSATLCYWAATGSKLNFPIPAGLIVICLTTRHKSPSQVVTPEPECLRYCPPLPTSQQLQPLLDPSLTGCNPQEPAWQPVPISSYYQILSVPAMAVVSTSWLDY